MLKKSVVLLCTLVLGVSLIACGKDANDNQASTEQESSTVESSVEVIEGEPIEGTESQVPEGSVEEIDTIQDEGISAIKVGVVNALGENYWPNTVMPVEFLEGYGLTSDMYDEFMGEMPMISTNVDTFIVIKAKEGQVEAVEGVLNAYRDNLVNDTMQYPMNVGKIQASQVVTAGNYVCFVQFGADVMTAMESGEEAVIKQCQEHNELAIQAIRDAVE